MDTDKLKQATELNKEIERNEYEISKIERLLQEPDENLWCNVGNDETGRKAISVGLDNIPNIKMMLRIRKNQLTLETENRKDQLNEL